MLSGVPGTPDLLPEYDTGSSITYNLQPNYG